MFTVFLFYILTQFTFAKLSFTSLPNFTPDRNGLECWNAGCRGDSGEVCDWCGLHNDQEQICCNGRAEYLNNHPNCNGAQFNSGIGGHQCVVKPPTQLFSVEGDCDVRQNCVSSKNYPNAHGENEACTVTIMADVTLTPSTPFHVETCCDHLFIYDQDVESAQDVPRHMYKFETLRWSTDYSVQFDGWEICFTEGTVPETYAPTWEPTSEPTPMDLFEVVGSCETRGNCVSTSNFPKPHGDHENCEVTMTKDVTVQVNDIFGVETCCDTLRINGIDVETKSQVPDVLEFGTTFTWTSDFSVAFMGWELCFEERLPYHASGMCELPRGDYAETCHSCLLEDCVLQCRCGMGKTQLNLKQRCRGKFVSNVGGALACPTTTIDDENLILGLYVPKGNKGELLGFQGECSHDANAGISVSQCSTKSHNIFTHTAEHTESVFNGLLWSFGQFVDHDLDLVRESEHESHHIQLDNGDIFKRSEGHCEDDGFGKLRNDITSILDLSSVYDDMKPAIRDSADASKLKLTDDVLPLDETHGFLCGDVRCSENPFLTAQHTLWAKHHNFIVDELRLKGIIDAYEMAKQINIATYQKVVMNEFVPALVGDFAEHEQYAGFMHSLTPIAGDQQCRRGVWLPLQDKVTAELCMHLVETLHEECNHGYFAHSEEKGCMCVPTAECELEPASDVTVYEVGPQHDVSISPLFAGAAYRLHMLVNDKFTLSNGQTSRLQDHFFKPDSYINEGKVDGWIQRLLATKSHRFGSHMSDSLQHALFCDPGKQNCKDLAALNCMRGMDMELPTYNEARELFGLPPRQYFDDLLDNCPDLAVLYDHQIENVELFIGGSCEDPVAGAVLGETFLAIVKDQFLRLRDGDPHFGQAHPQGEKYRNFREVLQVVTTLDNGNAYNSRFDETNVFNFKNWSM